MKKLFFMFMMMVATITLTSCGGNANADEATKDLAAQLEAGDVSKFQAALETVKTKAAELLAQNPEKAKELITTVQKFLSDNKEKVTALVGSNETVNALVASITSASADDVVSTLAGALGSVQDKAVDVAEGAQEGAQNLVDGAIGAAADAVQDAQNKVDEAVQGAQDKVDEAVQGAQNKVNEAIQGAQGKIDEAQDKANKAIQGALNK